MNTTRTLRFVAVFAVLIFTAGCDQATKHFARNGLTQRSQSFGAGMIEFTLAENPGAFLSLGASLPEATRSGLLTGGVAVGLALLLAYLLRDTKLDWLAFLGLTLVLSGGASNLIDRFFRHGLVTDFMVLRAGPLHTGVFNVADLAVVFGVTLLLIASFRPKRETVDEAE